jgi:hypothetical protein
VKIFTTVVILAVRLFSESVREIAPLAGENRLPGRHSAPLGG